jgi:hypothetical protein
MEHYLLIKCGYEGIEQLVMPSNEPDVLVKKINDIRNKIITAKEHRKRVNAAAGQDENTVVDAWGDLYVAQKITEEEWDLGLEEPRAYCIQKWDGVCFNCCCKELKVNIDDTTWWMM